MTLEDALFAALRDLVGNRVAPTVFPQPPLVPTWPAIRYSFPSVVPVIDQCGDGDDDTAEARVQLDVVAKTYAEVRALRRQVMARMKVFDPPALLQFSSGEFDEETRTYRELLQYLINGSSSQGSP